MIYVHVSELSNYFTGERNMDVTLFGTWEMLTSPLFGNKALLPLFAGTIVYDTAEMISRNQNEIRAVGYPIVIMDAFDEIHRYTFENLTLYYLHLQKPVLTIHDATATSFRVSIQDYPVVPSPGFPTDYPIPTLSSAIRYSTSPTMANALSIDMQSDLKLTGLMQQTTYYLTVTTNSTKTWPATVFTLDPLQAAYERLVSSGTHATIYTFLVDPTAANYAIMTSSVTSWRQTMLPSYYSRTTTLHNFALRICNTDGFTVYGSDCINSYDKVNDIPNNTRDPSGNYSIFQPMAEQSYVMAAFLNESGFYAQTKYDRVANATVRAIALRQGSINEPNGVISLHASF
jgi:hypothetical protein